jgi:hypothetical protein
MYLKCELTLAILKLFLNFVNIGLRENVYLDSICISTMYVGNVFPPVESKVLKWAHGRRGGLCVSYPLFSFDINKMWSVTIILCLDIIHHPVCI